ncbi:MAG: LytTR family transcriptional regulator [Candidatus Kapabacteria bacterium]|nr:LytTR family transcriptional regulator [Candidatus Kapabacteria bacterium]
MTTPQSSPPPSILAIFHRPFPLETDAKKRVIIATLFGIGVASVLLAFEPFGLSRYTGEWKTPIIGFYGVVTFVGLIFNFFITPRIVPQWFDEERWNVGKHIAISLWNVMLIGVLNYLYSRFIFLLPFHWMSLLYFVLWTFSIGIFPTIIWTLLLERRYWKQNVTAAAKITADIEELRSEHKERQAPSALTPKLITLIGTSAKEQYELNPASILCVQANDNYVTLYYESGENVKKVLFRATLKSLEDQLASQHNFYRCHKSYIVNLSNVFKVSGNAQGYKLHLSDLEFVVPVSRSLQNEMLDKLQHVERN